MTEFVEKLIERLEEIEEHCLDMHNWQGQSAIVEAKEIVNELAEEYQPNQAHQFAILHADILARLGIDISSVWETATQQAEALEQAYLRGRQDEREALNNGRITVSEDMSKQVIDVAELVEKFGQENVFTNADRIRAMDDSELAEFLKNTVWQNGANLFDCKEHLQECCVGHCEQCNAYLKWLQERTETHE